MGRGNQRQHSDSEDIADSDSSSHSSSSSPARRSGGWYGEATDGSDWRTSASCFVASNGTTWASQDVARKLSSPTEPQPLVELAQTVSPSLPPSRAVVVPGGASSQKKKKKKKRKRNASSSASQVVPSSADKENLSQRASPLTLVTSSKAATSTGRRMPEKPAKTIHPGEPPTAGATNTSSSTLLDPPPDSNASAAALPLLPYLYVERYDANPAPFVGQNERDLQGMITRELEEANDSDTLSPSRQLPSSDIHLNEPDLSFTFASFPNFVAGEGSSGLKRFRTLSEADSAYCSN